MCGQVTQRILTALLGGLLLVGCGSSGTSADARPPSPPSPPDADVSTQPEVQVPVSCPEPDAGVAADCGEDENSCIINPPGPAVGGGTIVTRQNPANYNTCKL